MLRRLLRSPRADVEVGVAIPIGCLVPLAALLFFELMIGCTGQLVSQEIVIAFNGFS